MRKRINFVEIAQQIGVFYIGKMTSKDLNLI